MERATKLLFSFEPHPAGGYNVISVGMTELEKIKQRRSDKDEYFNDRHNSKLGGPLKYLFKYLRK